MNNDREIIALISCSKSKKSHRCKAKELYSESQLFKLSYLYAKTITDKIYILSAKYGLISDEEEINPYEKALSTYDKDEKKIWGNAVLYQLSKISNLKNDKFLILAGKDYYEDLIGVIDNYELPLEKLRYGERINYLSEILENGTKVNNHKVLKDNKVYELQRKINELRKYDYSDINEVGFENGIYFFFEKGEKYIDLDRIVRVGTHRSQGRLKNRIKDHYKVNKDGSIFRKNIGRAILNFEKDEYLNIWNINFSDSKNIEKYKFRDVEKEKIIEDRISKYLKDKFKFACINVADHNLRMRLEEAIIATLNMDNEFIPSSSWAGRFSTESEIRNSGMWLKQGLDGQALTTIELNNLNEIIKNSHNNEEKIISNNEKQYEKVFNSTNNKSAADIIREHLRSIFRIYKLKGDKEVRVVSGEVNKDLGFKPHKHPQISQIMWEFYNEKYDVIEHTTPSGKSSTIAIIYDVSNKA